MELWKIKHRRTNIVEMWDRVTGVLVSMLLFIVESSIQLSVQGFCRKLNRFIDEKGEKLLVVFGVAQLY